MKTVKKYYVRQVVACFLSCCMFFNAPILLANPSPGGDVVPGPGNVIGTPLDWTGSSGLDAVVNTAAGNNIIGWNNFDIGANASVTFTQSSGWILNNVQDTAATGIYGGLSGSNCGLIVVNPLGVVFGPQALVTAQSFIASSMSIADADFIDGLPYTFAGGGVGDILVKEGAQIVAEEMAALIGQKVINNGTIQTGSGGFVVMAAGDSVLLGEPGSKIIVEMTSATSDIDGVGNVINEGEITAPGGQIVLAAGDIYSVPLHPQLEAGAVRVESGSGSVQQLGDIQAGAEGEVILTAGDEVVLGEESTTTTSAVDGEVIAYAYDFGDKEATTFFNDGAEISVGTGTATISGNHILFAGDVIASPEATIQIDPVTLTIADVMPVTGPELDTLYEEEHVEFYSQAGVNLDLAADELITVEYMTDGVISGGSGDILLRNVFDTGGIYFEREDEGALEPVGPRTAIHTTAFYGKTSYRDGGNIYMIAGGGGIIAGDLKTDTLSSDKFSEPGKIRLLTTNWGDIEVGEMFVDEGGFTEISAIASGNLTVNGDAISRNATVPKEDKTVGQARICLIAGNDYDEEDEGWEPKDVVFNGDVIEVQAHGKYETTADIRISATGNVYIGSAENQVTISAEAKTSEQKDATRATAYTVIHAGRTSPAAAGEIIINGDTYTSGSGYLTNGDIVAKAWPGPLSIDTDGTPSSSTGTKSVWEETDTDDPEHFFVRIEINNDEAVPLSNPDSPCYDCPKPEGLPPVPHIFVIMDDAETISWSDIGVFLDVLSNDDNGGPLDGFVSIYTLAGGTLDPIYDTDPISPTYGEVIGFEYTPPVDAVFTWDGIVDGSGNPVNPATFTDAFTYEAEDSEGNESINTATVTITVTNFLPTAAPDSDTIHMDETATFTLAAGGLITDSDGSPGDLELALSDPVFGDSSLSGSTAPADATYDPFEGFVGGDDFDYTVTDSTIIYPGDVTPESSTATLTVTVENTLPSGAVTLEDAHMDASGETLGVDSGDFTDADDDFVITDITAATGDENKTFGGTLLQWR
jgi:filamentous hemagglutinin family protein